MACSRLGLQDNGMTTKMVMGMMMIMTWYDDDNDDNNDADDGHITPWRSVASKQEHKSDDGDGDGDPRLLPTLLFPSRSFA